MGQINRAGTRGGSPRRGKTPRPGASTRGRFEYRILQRRGKCYLSRYLSCDRRALGRGARAPGHIRVIRARYTLGMLEQTLPCPATPAQSGRRPRRRQFLVLLRLACELSRGALILWLWFGRLQRDQQLREIQNWARRMLSILQIEVRCDGVPLDGRASLVIANHVSWLDVLVIQSLMPGRFVAKTEVLRWPVIGKLAQASGTIFVDRQSLKSTRAMVACSATALRQGYCVAGFPEGTSSEGADVSVFHANLFDAAVQAGVDVQPLVLRYVDDATGLRHGAAAFTADDSLVSSLHKVVASTTLSSRVHVGACIGSAGQTRKALASQAHQTIRDQLLQAKPARVP